MKNLAESANLIYSNATEFGEYYQKINSDDIVKVLGLVIKKILQEESLNREKDFGDTFKKIDHTKFLEAGKKFKEAGNDFFRDKDYEKAIENYGKAVLVFNEEQFLGNIFNSLTQVSLDLKQYLEAVSYCVSILRLSCGCSKLHNDNIGKFAPFVAKAKLRLVKALMALGQTELITEIKSELLDNCEPDSQKELEILIDTNTIDLSNKTKEDLQNLHSNENFISRDWLNPNIELRVISDKIGRGIFTKKDLSKGSIVMICKTNLESYHDELGSACNLDMNKDLMSFVSGELKEKLVNKTSDDACLAWRISQLHAGESIYQSFKLANMPLEWLMDGISPICLPLLPPGPEYVVNPVGLSSEQIEKILYINCHGESFEGDRKCGRLSSLFPVIAMTNHSVDYNCVLKNLGKDAIVLVC